MVYKIGIPAIILTAIALWLLNAIQVPCTATETFIENIPLNYTVVKEAEITEISTWFGLSRSRQAQALVQNADSATGLFTVNFIFSDGIQTLTKTVNQEIGAGEIRTVTSDVPLEGNVSVRTNVMPGTKQVSFQKEVTKQVPLGSFIGKDPSSKSC